MPKYEVIYKIQKTYRMVIDAENEEDADDKAIDYNLTDNKNFHLTPDDTWIASITELEE